MWSRTWRIKIYEKSEFEYLMETQSFLSRVEYIREIDKEFKTAFQVPRQSCLKKEHGTKSLGLKFFIDFL